MPFLIAKLGPLQGDGRRIVEARRRQTVDEVSGEAAAAPPGSLVLLHGTSPPWSALSRLHPARWPEGLGTPEDLWEARRGFEEHAFHSLLSSQGSYTLDARGVPCEVGLGRQNAPVKVVLNYTGWRLTDFPREPVKVAVCASPIGDVWIVPPDSVPAPSSATLPAREEWAPSRPSPAVSPSLPSNVALPPPPRFPGRPEPTISPPRVSARPSPMIPPSPRPFQTTKRWSELDFGDGHVTVVIEGVRATVETELARALYQEVRAELDEELPKGVVVRGTLGPEGHVEATVEGLGALANVFERVQFERFVRISVDSADWLDAEDLASRRPGGGGGRDPDDLIGILEFGLDKRAEAFRRLFGRRDRSDRLQMLPGRAVIVPLPAADGGPRWYAWEVVLDDHATYLFRPASKAARDAMLAWTQAPESRRSELLRDRELQAQLGYVRRVMHHDEGEQALGGWWRRLCRVTGARE